MINNSGRTKLDKVFDNKYHEVDITEDYFKNFNLNNDVNFVEKNSFYNPDDNLNERRLMEEIDKLIDAKFPSIKVVVNHKVKRVNKEKMNIIFGHVSENISSDYTIVDIWYYLSQYLDIEDSRFYENLEDKYKNQLLAFLVDNTDLVKKLNLDDMY